MMICQKEQTQVIIFHLTCKLQGIIGLKLITKDEKHSSSQDYHGYEDLRDSSIAHQKNRRECSRSREVREIF